MSDSNMALPLRGRAGGLCPEPVPVSAVPALIPSAAHTPGPWTVQAGDSVVYILDASGQRLAVTDTKRYWERHDDEDVANAILIAASTMLLEGAQDTVAGLKLLRIGLANGVVDEPKMIEVIDAHIDELTYAIAAATGIPQ